MRAIVPANEKRASWGADAVATNPDDNGKETNLVDVLANLMHYASREGIDWDIAIAAASDHYQHEIEFPEGE